MKQGRVFKYSMVVGWFVIALAAVLVATILIPEESRSSRFWQRVLWTEILILLFWGSAFFFLLASQKAKDHLTRFGGIAPTICAVTAVYVLLSFAAMMIHAFTPLTDTGDRVHLVIQIISFSGVVLCVVFLSIARAGATTGIDFDKTKAMSPRELHDLLAMRESVLVGTDNDSPDMLKTSIKQLREALLYSLNESASLAESPEYQSLSRDVQELCLSAEEKHEDSADHKHFSSLVEEAKGLKAKAKLIASKQERR